MAAFTTTASESTELWLYPAALTAFTLNTYSAPVVRPWHVNLNTEKGIKTKQNKNVMSLIFLFTQFEGRTFSNAKLIWGLCCSGHRNDLINPCGWSHEGYTEARGEELTDFMKH